MEIDSLLGSQRWKIIEIVSEIPSSPIEIASRMKTSVAYISQQLKLLEAAGIIKKEKTGSSEKGKPRNLYQITEEALYLTLLSNGKAEKKLVKVSERQKIIVRTWFLPNENIRYFVEKIFWEIENELNDIRGIFVDSGKIKNSLIIVSDSKKVKQKIEQVGKTFGSIIEIQLNNERQLVEREHTQIHTIYDPNFLMKEKIKLKGGVK